MKLIDVTVPLDANVPTYPGNARFQLEAVKRLAHGDTSNVSTVRMSAHAGTHVDAPRHFFDTGAGAEALPLDLLCGRARVIELTTRKGITPDDLAPFDLRDDVRLLIKTRNSLLWGSPQFHDNFIGVTAEAARFLVEQGVRLVGVDYLSVEEYRAPGAPAHHALLGAGTIVIEGLNLRHVEPGSYELLCLPLAIVGSDGAPARAVLRRN
jgi:arylformamidase